MLAVPVRRGLPRAYGSMVRIPRQPRPPHTHPNLATAFISKRDIGEHSRRRLRTWPGKR